MQTSFSEYEYASKKRQTRRDRFLAEIEAMTPWGELVAAIERHYPKGGGRGRPPIGLERMLRMYIAQNCFGLSDEGIEDAIYDSQAIRRFVGIDLGRESAPDATTLLKFRRLLEDKQLTDRSRRAGLEVLEKARPVACRRCGSLRVVRNGHRGELQRYLCRDCGKTSNATTDTPLARLRRRETFEAYARCLAKGFTVRQAAKACSVSVSTAHRWRLRFLEKVVEHQPKALSGLLEVDETYFRISHTHKGSRSLARPPRHRGGEGAGRGRKASEWAPVLVGRLRGQRYTTDKLLTRVTAAEVTRALRDVVRRGQTVVCTDGGSAFLNLEKDLGVPAKSLVVGYDGHVMDGVYHVQSANSYHERLKSWVNRQLRGVATKNLPLYLAWMRLRTWGASGVEPCDILTSALGKQVINL